MYEQLIDTLADLHVIDPEAAGSATSASPAIISSARSMRWTRQYRDIQTDYLPEMERLIAFLPEIVPEQSRTSIVHGDYRIDNVVFDGDGTLTAVLDWELATLGDPVADFSYLAMQWMMPADGAAGLAGLDLAALGIPSLDEIVARYSERSGVPVSGKLDWYFAYNLFRLAGHRPGHQEACHRRNRDACTCAGNGQARADAGAGGVELCGEGGRLATK